MKMIEKLNLEVAILACRLSTKDGDRKWYPVSEEKFMEEYEKMIMSNEKSLSNTTNPELKEKLARDLERRKEIRDKIASIDDWDTFIKNLLNQEYYVEGSDSHFRDEAEVRL